MMIRLVLSLATLVSLVGCATYSAHSLPPVSAGNLVDREAWEGLTIGVSLPSEDQVEHYFGANLLDENILPVAIYLENRASDSDFTILAEDVEYTLPNGENLRPQSPRQVCKRVGSDSAMLSDYMSKSFESLNLPANDGVTHRKVLFFRSPSSMSLDETNYENGTLQIRVTRYQVDGQSANSSPEKVLQIYFRKR